MIRIITYNVNGIRADFGEISVVSVYHPSGSSGDHRQAFKMVWLSDFQNYVTELQKTRTQLVISGDYNICHEAIDIHDPVRNNMVSENLKDRITRVAILARAKHSDHCPVLVEIDD